MKTFGTVLVLTLVGLGGFVLLEALPDIQRYLRIRSM
ncbi:DUF6893 family small protein [Tengunoibacter tsumagoiensis]